MRNAIRKRTEIESIKSSFVAMKIDKTTTIRSIIGFFDFKTIGTIRKLQTSFFVQFKKKLCINKAYF